MRPRSNQNISENTGKRIQYVRNCLLALNDLLNKPIQQLEDFIEEHRRESIEFLRNLINSDPESRAGLFQYEYLLNLDSNQEVIMPPPEHGLIGRKSIRVEIEFLGP
jgi:hypothetical protein